MQKPRYLIIESSPIINHYDAIIGRTENVYSTAYTRGFAEYKAGKRNELMQDADLPYYYVKDTCPDPLPRRDAGYMDQFNIPF